MVKNSKKQLKKNTRSQNLPQLKRLNRINGQILGISRMIEEERNCLEILQQIKAAKSALASVELNIINEHLSFCVDKFSKTHEKKVITEIKELLQRVSK